MLEVFLVCVGLVCGVNYYSRNNKLMLLDIKVVVSGMFMIVGMVIFDDMVMNFGERCWEVMVFRVSIRL